jgi:ubiquinone/menaquinone biosynthesis C-methylase UbiE
MNKPIQLSVLMKDHLEKLFPDRFSLTGNKLKRFLGKDFDDCEFLNFVGASFDAATLGFAFQSVENNTSPLVACVLKVKGQTIVKLLTFNEFRMRMRILNKISNGISALSIVEVFSIAPHIVS